MTYGVTEHGFVIKPLSVIVAEIIADIKAAQPNAVFDPSTMNSQVVATASTREYALWQMLQAMHAARNVYNAANTQLDDLVVLNGIRRYMATYSYIFGVKIVGQPGTVVPVGFTIVSTVNPAIKFQTTAKATIGVSTGAYAPATYGDVTVDVRSVTKGRFTAAAGTVTTIEKGVFGIEYVVQAADAVPGRNTESDQELLARRELAVSTTTGSTPEGMIRALMFLNEDTTKVPLTYVRVFKNNTSVTDVRGRPPHSMECVVEQQGLTTTRDTEIAQAILNAAGCGTAIFGTVSPITVYDYKGKAYQISFTRPTAVPIHVAVTLSVRSELTADEIAALKLDIATAGNALGIGTDVAVIGANGLASQLKNPKIITGSMLIGKTVTPVSTYIDILDGETGAPEHATFSTTHISISQAVL